MTLPTTSSSNQCLKIGDTEEGTLAIRVADALWQDRGASSATPKAWVGTENIWGESSAWVEYSAKVRANYR